MKEGMTYRKIGDVAIVSAGQGAPQGDENYSQNGIPFIKAGNLEYLVNGGDEGEVQKVSAEVAAQHRLKLYPAGSVVFAKSGMSCLKGYVYSLKNDCYVVSHLAILTPQNVLSSYLSYCLQYYKPNTLIKDNAYPSISLTDIADYTIPCPALEQQGHIVEELDCLSSIVADKKQQLSDIDNLSQAIFFEMFGDPLTNERGWDVKRLGDLSSLITNGNTPKGGANVYTTSGYMFLRSQNVWKNKLELEDVVYIDEKIHKQLKRSSLRRNDLLITKTGRINTENSSLGRTALFTGADDSANINGHVYLVRLLEGISHEFVLRILISNSYRDYIRKVCVGGIDKRQLNQTHIEDFPIILPPLELQMEFADKMKSLENSKKEIESSLSEFENLLAQRMEFHFA